MKNHDKIKCPNCGKSNTWTLENRYKPFCSDRCKLIDLGEWANETRKIPGAAAVDSNATDGNDPNDSDDHSF